MIEVGHRVPEMGGEVLDFVVYDGEPFAGEEVLHEGASGEEMFASENAVSVDDPVGRYG